MRFYIISVSHYIPDTVKYSVRNNNIVTKAHSPYIGNHSKSLFHYLHGSYNDNEK